MINTFLISLFVSWITIFNCYSQTKKEQILILSNSIDSLNALIGKERTLSKEMYKKFQQESAKLEKQSSKADSLNRELKKLTAQLKIKNDLTIKTDTLQLSEVETYETCVALYFKGNDVMDEDIEIPFYLGRSSEDLVLDDNFFIINKDYDVYEGNNSLVGNYYAITYDISEPYLFYDCGPLGEEDRRNGEGRPVSIGFQLLSVKKL